MMMSAQSWASAAFYIGNDLIESCEKKETMCMVFMMGVADTFSLLIETEGFVSQLPFCPPNSVTGFQLARIMAKYLNENPEYLADGAAGLAQVALYEAFPCKE
jgi:hypothetical protein